MLLHRDSAVHVLCCKLLTLGICVGVEENRVRGIHFNATFQHFLKMCLFEPFSPAEGLSATATGLRLE